MKDLPIWRLFRVVVTSGQPKAEQRYFEALWPLIRKDLTRFAQSLINTHNRHLLPGYLLDAEEVAEEAFSEMFRQRSRITGDPASWILATIKGIVRNRIAKAWREIQSNQDAQRHLDRQRRPRRLRSSIPDDERRRLLEAIERLSPRLRTVVVMVYFDDESIATTAAKLGITQNGVVQALRRALVKLKKLLGI